MQQLNLTLALIWTVVDHLGINKVLKVKEENKITLIFTSYKKEQCVLHETIMTNTLIYLFLNLISFLETGPPSVTYKLSLRP